MLSLVKRFGRRYRWLHKTWGKIRWYSSRDGLQALRMSVQHVGWARQCPICGWRGRAFYAHGEPHLRPNALCPRCYSKERHRLLLLYLKERTTLFRKSATVLEIAPGPYSYRLFSKLDHISYTTLDYDSPLAQLQGDITSLPFPASSFDFVICYHVLEHVPDDFAAMQELMRVLRHTGLLLVQVPIEREVTYEDPSVTSKAHRLRVFGQDDHVRIYGHDFVDRLQAVGFKVNIDDFASHLPPSTTHLYGLSRNELIYTCTTNS